MTTGAAPMPENRPLLHRVDDLFENALGLPTPALDTDLFDSRSMDSLEFAALLLKLEEEFGFHIGFEEMDMDRFRSISGIAS